MCRRLLLALLAALPAFAQYKMQTPAGEAPGPWLFGTIGIGKGADGQPLTTALKGLALKLGEKGEAGIVYDLDLCRVAGAWTGGKFVTPMNLMSRGEYPTALGEVLFTTGPVPGFQIEPKPGTASVPDAATPVSDAEKPVGFAQKPVASSEKPMADGKKPMGFSEKPMADDKKPMGFSEKPMADDKKPMGFSEKPMADDKKPMGFSEKPMADGKKPMGFSEKPMTDGKKPMGFSEKPMADGEKPMGFSEKDTGKTAAPNPPAPSGQQKEPPAPPTAATGGWIDPRPEPFGPLPPGQARFKGLSVAGGKPVLKWDIGGVEVIEMPEAVRRESGVELTRHFRLGPAKQPVWVALGPGRFATDAEITLDEKFKALASGPQPGVPPGGSSGSNPLIYHDVSYTVPATIQAAAGTITMGGHIADVALLHRGGTLFARLAPHASPRRVFFTLAPGASAPAPASPAAKTGWQSYGARETNAANSQRLLAPPNFDELLAGGPARWPDAITTTATLSPDTASAYVVDTVKLPDPNPWGAPMFVSGFDFFETGKQKADTGKAAAPPHSSSVIRHSAAWSAAVSTFHGDVFLVAGLEGDLAEVTWRRFASGLYHPLGLKIVGGDVFVTCRDGLYRLRDTNGDGEADFYEAFNHDVKVTKNFHEFVFDLQTDAAGSFYFAKAGPVRNGGQGFEQIMAHHGTLLRVSPDGAKLDVVATGFRAPNGIGIGPRGELTSGDNEGTWTPACKINWITPGAFCGVVPLAHRDPPPTDYARPLCWLPKRVDNSGGSQVWVPDDERFGPWRGQLLHLSYGKAALYGVLREEVGGVTQGGVARFPLKFDSGIMRARFHPRDGTLWVAGLRGWQTDGLRNGCLQRVRFTGQPARMPIALHARKTGVEVRFTDSLDTQSAADPENWQVETWNYAWTAAYGSPELSPATGQRGHDPLKVRAVHIGTDDRTATLEIEGLAPVMQMAIKYRLKTADGTPLEGEIVNTIHALGE